MALSSHALELRAGRLTGTTTAAALGLHSTKSPLWAFRQALGIGEDKVTEPMDWGLRLEPAIAGRFAEARGITLADMGTRQHPEHPFWAASGDYRISAREALEVKTAGRVRKIDLFDVDDEDDNPEFDETLAWGPAGSADIPPEYIVQAAVQMAVFDLDAVWVAVLIGGNDYREYYRTRDLEFEQMLADGSRRFYEEHLLPKTAPPARDTAELLALLASLYPSDNGVTLEATPDILESIERLRGLKADAKATKALIDEEALVVKAFLGEASAIGSVTKPLVTYRQAKASAVTDWESVALESGATAETIARHTTQKPGSRRLLVK